MKNVNGDVKRERVFGRVSSECTSGTRKATPRNEALLEAAVKQANTTRHPLLVECVVNLCPEDFERAGGFKGIGCMQ